jgi:uncharacterized protein
MQSLALMFKGAFWAIFLCLALISFPLPSFAVAVQDVPNPRQIDRSWVTDMANLLNPQTKAKVNQLISQLEAETGTEIAVVTVPDTAPAPTPKQFATKLFNYWGIGKIGRNNGILFLISKSDRRVEIETGYGIEKILPNARVGNIIDQLIIPHFKQGDFAGGTLAGIQALTKALERRDTLAITSPITSKHQPNSQAYLGFLVIGLILVLMGVGIVWSIVGIVQATNGDGDNQRRRRGGSRSNDSWSGDGGSWDSDSGGSWGGSDSGSFGGGDSGGGGDGGGW